jgi:hypothetical protein
MSKVSNSDNHFGNEDEFSELYYQFLKDEGRILPQTIEDVKKAEDDGREVDFSDLPPALQNPKAVFERKKKFELGLIPFDVTPTVEDEAQVYRKAARLGKEITPEIKAKMEQARTKAESDAKSENETPSE